MRSFGLIIFLFFFISGLSAQVQIKLKNPSFEDKPQHAKVPKGWKDCGLENESPPDIQPVGGSFRVTRRPLDGNTYLAMIVRDNDSWESVGQKLKKPLQSDKCYSFSINLCKSDFYLSRSRITGDVTNYNIPIRLLIWGGNELCQKRELLAASPLIQNYDWMNYDFVFHPKEELNYITLEAYYNEHYVLPYCGNILVDNASVIMEGCALDSQWVSAPPTEVLRWTAVENESDLTKLVLNIGPKVKFQADEAMLEKHKYKLEENGATITQNRYLQILVKATQSQQNSKLVIAVKGRFLSLEKERRNNIENALLLLGLKRAQFEVKIYNKDTSGESWLWTGGRQDILMRLESI